MKPKSCPRCNFQANRCQCANMPPDNFPCPYCHTPQFSCKCDNWKTYTSETYDSVADAAARMLQRIIERTSKACLPAPPVANSQPTLSMPAAAKTAGPSPSKENQEPSSTLPPKNEPSPEATPPTPATSSSDSENAALVTDCPF